MGFIRFVFFGYLGLTVIYWLINIYSRSVRLERLENEWTEGHPDDEASDARQSFLDDGMATYHASFRPKLIGLVYIIPTILVIVALVVRNSN